MQCQYYVCSLILADELKLLCLVGVLHGLLTPSFENVRLWLDSGSLNKKLYTFPYLSIDCVVPKCWVRRASLRDLPGCPRRDSAAVLQYHICEGHTWMVSCTFFGHVELNSSCFRISVSPERTTEVMWHVNKWKRFTSNHADCFYSRSNSHPTKV